jgi:hypothetical protein
MDELLKLIFGVRPAQAAVQEPQAFPIVDQPVSVMDIPRLSEYEADMRIAPPVEAQAQAPQSGMRFPNISMPNFNLPSMPSLPMPNVPEYMSGLIGDPAAAQQQAQRSGLLNAAIALLEAGGPQQQRTTLGQAAGRGLGAYQQGVQGTFDQMLQGMLLKSKLAPQEPEAIRTLRILANEPRLMQTQLAKSAAGATKITMPGGNLTPGQEAIDKKFAETYLDWTTGGGSDVTAQLAQIKPVIDLLEQNKPITGVGVAVQPDLLLAMTNPSALQSRQQIEEITQRNLKLLLGAQFTAKEGEQLIARAFNPQLPPAENAMRVRKLFMQMATAAEQKQAMVDYFEQEGSLRGFKGRMPSVADFEKAIEGAKLPASPSSAKPPSSKAPAGVRQEDWDAMLPEEKALWQNN